MEHTNTYCYSFPAVRGQQAGRPFYIATCPLRLIPKIFVFDEEEVPPELRAQRELNKQRIPEMARYLVDNPQDYIFSAITASVDTDVEFEASGKNSDLGTLRVQMDSNILINDGQHRRKAIEEAIKDSPELGQDNIAVVFFIDEGLKRSQQMFADLNKYAIRPSSSLNVLYDHRDACSGIARYLSSNVKPFVGYTEMERSSIAPKSPKLFALSSIKLATRALLGKGSKDSYEEQDQSVATQFWAALNEHVPEWKLVQRKELSPTQMRQEFIHAHGIGLHALGVAGHDLIAAHPDDWEKKLSALKGIDWRKANPTWNNRALHNGKLSKSSTNIKLTANVIKQALGLALSPDEEKLEKQFSK
ncbi:MAG: DNA sulfur modification protein DndB [Cellvibrionaceae bacterium]|nr:DNA sulfur modification protein DndB [Cellvibrionaceae bacterium]